MLETFMRQYASGDFHLEDDDIMKFKNDGKEVDTLNTTFNKEIYLKFKSSCKAKGYFVKHVVAAFMEKYSERNLVLGYIDVAEEE
jgi:disulfide oxidoreductase YuzD